MDTIDPFTTNDIEIPLEDMLKFSNGRLTEPDCKAIYTEFILRAEHCRIAPIAELKKNFNLNWSAFEVGEIKARFAEYGPAIDGYLGEASRTSIAE
jgi:hypothetical protein